MRNPGESIAREIAVLRRSLKAVDRSLRRLSPKLRAAATGGRNATGKQPGRKLKLSPKRRAQLKLQGQYIGYVRQLKPKQKVEVTKIREKKGAQAAIRRAKDLMRRKKAA